MGFRGEGGLEVTDEMLDAWADAAERGDYPGEGPTLVYEGRYLPTDADVAQLVDAAVELPPDLLALVDARAKREGVSRSEFVRASLVGRLATV